MNLYNKSESSCDINLKDYETGWTALHYCVFHGNLKFLNFLLINEADIDCKNNKGLTPLMIACIQYFQYKKILKE